MSKTIEFLQMFSTVGPWVLTAINPDGKGIDTKTFHSDQTGQLSKWLAKYNGKWNLYFHVNSVLRDLNKKAERKDIKSVDWLHVDLDPRDSFDLQQERDRILGLLMDNRPKGVPNPTCIIFSGGGYQAFWKLREPFDVNGDLGLAEEAKRYNQQLEHLYAADNCHNIDRIMRLPETINIPDERKRKKGRTETEAYVVEFEAKRVYNLSDFSKAQSEPKAQLSDAATAQQSPTYIDSVEQLKQYNLHERVMAAIVQGHDPEHPKEKDNSRSAWVFDVACEMVKKDVTDDITLGVLLNEQFGISESVLETSNPYEYALRQIRRAKEYAIAPLLPELNDKYAVIGNIGGKCRVIEYADDPELNRSSLSFQNFTDFKNRYIHKKVIVGFKNNGNPIEVPAGKWWLEHPKRRSYEALGLYPKGCPSHIFNLWTGFAIKPVEGEWSLMKKHLLEVVACGNQDHYDYIVKWLAFTVQYPEIVAEVALVFKGGRGTGKGVVGNSVLQFFGQHGLHISNSAHLAGKFNAHLADVCFLFADEAYWPGNKSAEGNLKALITEKQIAVERKGIDVMQVPNRLHIIMASNESWIVPAGEDERRFAVFEVSSKYQQNRTYFAALFAEQENGGIAAMLNDLLQIDLGGWHPRDNIPKTQALNEQIIASLGPVERAWFDILCEGECHFEFHEGAFYHIATATLTKLSSDLSYGKKPSPHSVGAFLGHPRKNRDGSSAQAKSMGFQKERSKRPSGYWVPELHEARAIWDRIMFSYAWDDQAHWKVDNQSFAEPPF